MTDFTPSTLPQVLILDDERGICEFVADVGDDCGFDATWCDNFQDFACRYSVDLNGIFLDLMMPDVDGIEIIRFLGDNKSSALIVLMSGHDSHVLDAARRLAQSRGLKVVATLRKPFSLNELTTVYQVLKRVESPKPAHAAPRHSTHTFRPEREDLEAALDAGHILPYFQPKFRVSDRALVGAEVLARWRCPDNGMIGPDRFIPLAEREGLIDALTDQIMQSALDQARLWQAEGHTVRLAINLSPVSLRRLDFPDLVQHWVSQRGLLAANVTLEVTESALAVDYSASLDILTRLRMRQFGLSIDDFGTGYSSLRQLQNSPFTELKVDQSFVAKALSEDGSRAIVESSVALGHRLGLKVVAEGIETESQMSLIQELGCDEAQGYLLGRPVPAADFPF